MEFDRETFLDGYKEAKVLTTTGRARIKQKNFAIPQKAEGKEEKKESGNYPIPDISHARNALSRVSQFGTSDEKAQVRAKVDAKFPQLKKRKQQKEGHATSYTLPGGSNPVVDMLNDWVEMFQDGRVTMQGYRDRVNAENAKEAEGTGCPGYRDIAMDKTKKRNKKKKKQQKKAEGDCPGESTIGTQEKPKVKTKKQVMKDKKKLEKQGEDAGFDKKLLAAHIRDKLAANLPSLPRMTKEDLFMLLTRVHQKAAAEPIHGTPGIGMISTLPAAQQRQQRSTQLDKQLAEQKRRAAAIKQKTKASKGKSFAQQSKTWGYKPTNLKAYQQAEKAKTQVQR